MFVISVGYHISIIKIHVVLSFHVLSLMGCEISAFM